MIVPKIVNTYCVCKDCKRQDINYTIENGSFVYYCVNCKKTKTKEEIFIIS